MKFQRIKTYIVLTLTIVVLSCEDHSIIVDTEVLDYPSVSRDEDSFVSIDEATNVAKVFWNNSDSGMDTRSTSTGLCVSAICQNNEPRMYIFNQQGHGFLIVGASHNYYPILAFSNSNNFDLSGMSIGLSLWIEETKAAIQNSTFFDDSIKKRMNQLWLDFEDNNKTIELCNNIQTRSSYSPAEIACWNRCEELFDQYSSEGWNFAPLSSASAVFSDLGLSYYYDNLCYSANYNHSNVNCSVVGWKTDNTINQVGPLLNTQWHQHEPFNDLCNGHLAGCGAIAVAQVMKYHEYPNTIPYNGQTFDWSSVPNYPDSSSNQNKLVRLIGDRADMHYWDGFSWATPQNIKNCLESFGYNVSLSDDNYEDVESELFLQHRPVMMLGNEDNLEFLIGPTQYMSDGSHYWVCDGGRTQYSGRLLVCAEWQPYGNGQFVQNSYSPTNPNAVGGTSYLYYHMNWGWRNGSSNGWFAFNGISYQYSRKNYFISTP